MPLTTYIYFFWPLLSLVIVLYCVVTVQLALYCDDSNAQPFISTAVFIELMKSATSEVEFSFKQTEGVAMSSML